MICSYLCYWWTERDNHIEIFRKETKNDNLEKRHPIFSKYIQNPYEINIWNIINEANRKYKENQTKYLVYSCPFMCGGKRIRLIFLIIKSK